MIGLMTPHLLHSPIKRRNVHNPMKRGNVHSPMKRGNAKTPATDKGAQVASSKKGNTVDKTTNIDNYFISRRHSSPAALHSSPAEPEPHIQFNLDLQNNRQKEVAPPDEPADPILEAQDTEKDVFPESHHQNSKHAEVTSRDELADPMLEAQDTEKDVFPESHHQNSKHAEVTSQDELADPMLEAQNTEAPDETLEITLEGQAKQPNTSRAASNNMRTLLPEVAQEIRPYSINRENQSDIPLHFFEVAPESNGKPVAQSRQPHSVHVVSPVQILPSKAATSEKNASTDKAAAQNPNAGPRYLRTRDVVPNVARDTRASITRDVRPNITRDTRLSNKPYSQINIYGDVIILKS